MLLAYVQGLLACGVAPAVDPGIPAPASLPLTTPTDSHGHTHSPITLASIAGWGPRGGPGRGSFVTLSLCGDSAIIRGRTGVTWLGSGSTGVETRLPGTTCGALPPTQVSNKQYRLPAPFPNAH